MCVIPELTQRRLLLQLESASAVFLSPDHRFELTPTELAELRGVARSTVYRQAHWLQQQLLCLRPLESRCTDLVAENHALKARIQQLEDQLTPYQRGHWVKVTPERMAMTTLEMTARHHSISDVQATLKTAFSLTKPPSDGTIFNIIDQGARLAEQIIDSVSYHYPLSALEFDELFHAGFPILAALEPYSMSLVLLEQLGNCRAHTWKFALDYRNIVPPELMVHDCSQQGILLVKLFERDSQLCIFHRIREIGHELHPSIEKLYEKALDTEDEHLWHVAGWMENQLKSISEVTHLLDFEQRKVRRFDEACVDLFGWCGELREWMEETGMSSPSLSGFEVRPQYLTHLKLWEKLAEQVQWVEGTVDCDGFRLLDALAAVKITGCVLEDIFNKYGSCERYWEEQAFYVRACERLRKLQACVTNNGYIEKIVDLMCGDLVRTSSRVEALNRRLRGFTDAKRQVTDRQLRLMHLHHNTTPFSADAKRAGKSPWQWLGLDVSGICDGFVGVLKAANGEATWPSPWAFKP